jgi:hypothetical protein
MRDQDPDKSPGLLAPEGYIPMLIPRERSIQFWRS